MMAYDVPTPPAASMGTDFAILGNGEIGIPVHKGPTYLATVGPSGAIADSGPLHQDDAREKQPLSARSGRGRVG